MPSSRPRRSSGERVPRMAPTKEAQDRWRGQLLSLWQVRLDGEFASPPASRALPLTHSSTPPVRVIRKSRKRSSSKPSLAIPSGLTATRSHPRSARRPSNVLTPGTRPYCLVFSRFVATLLTSRRASLTRSCYVRVTEIGGTLRPERVTQFDFTILYIAKATLSSCQPYCHSVMLFEALHAIAPLATVADGQSSSGCSARFKPLPLSSSPIL